MDSEFASYRIIIVVLLFVAESTGVALNESLPSNTHPETVALASRSTDPRDVLPLHKRPSHQLGKGSKQETSYEDVKYDNDQSAGVTDSWKDRMQSDSLQKKRKKRPRKTDILRSANGKGYSNEYRIKRKLLLHYDKTTRPVRNDSTTTMLFVGMSLYHILDTNEKFQTLSALIAIRLRWIDEYLTWNPDEYEGVNEIWVPAIHIWTPDIFINNFADNSFQDFMNTFAIVTYDGHVLWMFPAVSKTYCTLDVRHFPFDRQKCKIIFISWTFNGFKVDLTYNKSEENAIYYKPKNQEWNVDQVTVERHEKTYACCIEFYPDVTFTIHMTRRSLFYIVNLIFPCLLIYAVSFLGFFLPVESGEKVNLQITILLALVVFLLIVGETLPPTPDAIPVLGMLFGTTMVMVSISLLMAVIVTNIYLRKDSGHRVPAWVRRTLLRPRARREKLRRRVFNSNDNHVNDGTIGQDIEIDNLSHMTERDSLTSSRRQGGTRATNSIYNRPSVREKNAEWAEEWDRVAKLADRVFFWLFTIASAAALVSMFAPIPTI